jgi:hypothetical protein
MKDHKSYLFSLAFSISQIHITNEVYGDRNIVNTSLFSESPKQTYVSPPQMT